MTRSLGADITGLLERIRADDAEAVDQLLSQLYGELRRAAAQFMGNEPPGHTLQPTALVHETLQRLLAGNALKNAPDRRYLFAAIYRTMRRVLAEHARRRLTAKRGGSYRRVEFDDVLDQLTGRWSLSDVDLVAVDEALEILAQRSTRQRSVIDLKVFGELSNREIAEQLGVSEGTVERDFRLARAFLSRQLAALEGR
jgi:RNA polymerase sigma factor (TIGR02999 family)